MNQRLIILHTYRLTNKHWFIFIPFNSRCAAKNKYEIINSVLKTACLGRYRKYKYKVNSKHYGAKPLCTDRALRNNKLGMYIKGPMAKGKWKDEYKTVDMDHGALPNLHLVSCKMTKNVETYFITQKVWMSKLNCHLFMIFISQYFGLEALNSSKHTK